MNIGTNPQIIDFHDNLLSSTVLNRLPEGWGLTEISPRREKDLKLLSVSYSKSLEDKKHFSPQTM